MAPVAGVSRPARSARLVARATGVRPDEREAVAWSFALFFCVFASWYALRPVRDALGVAGSARDLPRLFLVTLGATLAVAPVVSALVSRVPRGRALAVAYRAIAVTLLALFVLLRAPATSALAGRAFFVWASVLNLAEIALAWALMADVFTREQGIRLFALVGGGGTLGAIVGAAVAGALAQRADATWALVVSAALLEAAVRCVRGVARAAPRGDHLRAPYAAGGVLRWLRRTARDPFFLGVCAYLVLFTFTSTTLYLEQGRIVKAALATTSERAAFFARIDFAVNATTLLLQLFVAGRVVRRVGVGAALAALPLFTLACFVALRAAPVLAVLAVCQIARRALDFALAKPAREVLFTVVRPEDRYKAKSFIDTFVYRSGDAVAAVSLEHVGTPALVLGVGVVCGAWAIVGVALGRATPREERAASGRDVACGA
jgi:AAA family ATP:ADP antiporter